MRTYKTGNFHLHHDTPSHLGEGGQNGFYNINNFGFILRFVPTFVYKIPAAEFLQVFRVYALQEVGLNHPYVSIFLVAVGSVHIRLASAQVSAVRPSMHSNEGKKCCSSGRHFQEMRWAKLITTLQGIRHYLLVNEAFGNLWRGGIWNVVKLFVRKESI